MTSEDINFIEQEELDKIDDEIKVINVGSEKINYKTTQGTNRFNFFIVYA